MARKTIILLVAMILACCTAAGAETITFDWKSGISDTLLSRYSPDTNYGDYSYNAVYNTWNGSVGYESLLMFENLFGDEPGQIPLGSTINEASLRMYFYTGYGDGERDLYRMTTSWSEDSTWNSMGGGVTVGKQTEASADSTYTDPSKRGFFGLDVTSSLQAWADGQANQGWLIVGTGGNYNYSFYASSNISSTGWRPTLSVDYTAPSAGAPEPGTLLLLGSAGAFLFSRRRWLRRLLNS